MTSREQMQALIRAEIDRQRPVAVARRTLELLVESATRATDAPPGYQVVDRDGAMRTRSVAGEAVPLGLGDLIAELRRQHPSLFLPPAPDAADAAPAARPAAANPGSPAAARDWMMVAPGSAAPREAVRAESPSRPATILQAAAARLGASLRRPAPTPAAAVYPAAAAAPSAAGAASMPPAGPAAPAPDPIGPAPVPDALRPAPAPRPADGPRPAGEPPPSEARASEGLRPGVARPRRLPGRASGRKPLYAALGALVLVGAGYLALRGDEPAPEAGPSAVTASPGRRKTADARPGEAKPGEVRPSDAAAAKREPVETGTLTPDAPATLAGVAEVVDTATLRLGSRTLRLFGVESAKGAQAGDLSTYLGGRPVNCQPAATRTAYLCAVDGHDLSEVVLYNGGGRATPEATPDLIEAERHARTEKLGIWATR
ncbi:hypothetical protein OPKNFCMD_5368 [Methylobacterium crusticola]|uniref:TNase-like domain-containing protein n=1 Tax=Methylobacterium crusticola TaxID=1697972 RepID=A0ABQ4R4L5_9HYPH|nr:hypothetical protein [Methylobacterium crusticola]GJD52602.1 hypothetical protein OPKNFCMD_5368 [Methylobacterium crusticola]